MKKVSDLMKTKNGELWSVAPADSVQDALRVMAEKDIGAVLVFDEDRLVGICSERDYARSVVLKGKASRDTPVMEIMAAAVFYVRPENTIDDCMALMTEKRLRHLPVIEGDAVVGMVSIGDVVKTIISEQGTRIKQLENHITGVDYFHRF